MANALTLHEALLQVHPSTASSVVGEIVAVGQAIAGEIENIQARLADEEKWVSACVRAQEALLLAQQARADGELDEALAHAETAFEHFTDAEAEEGKHTASTLIEQLRKDGDQARAQERLTHGQEALSRDDIAGARAAGAEAREAAEACASVPLIREVEALVTCIEARDHQLMSLEQGRKRLAEAENAMTTHQFSAAHAALASAKSMLEIARDEHGVVRVRELEAEVHAAEASRSSGEALAEAEAALLRADLQGASAAVGAAMKVLLKADRSCEEAEALQRRIEGAQRASAARCEADELLENAFNLSREYGAQKVQILKSQLSGDFL